MAAGMQEYYELLRLTSRTFSIGIEALPRPLREATTLAYLALRVSDYFEDSPTLDDETKRRALALWAEAVRRTPGGSEGDRAAAELRDAVAAADRALPDHAAAVRAPQVLAGLLRLPPAFRSPIAQHVADTTEGMRDWVARGPDFPDEAALDRYMFEVAGRVGILLTELFGAHSGRVGARKERLMDKAVSFGLGLQTVNVIRGLHEDPDRGWSYIPRDLLPSRAPPPDGSRDDSPVARPADLDPGEQERVLAFLVRKAGRHIADALDYCALLPRRDRGLRIFCTVPALLASRTAELSHHDREVFQRGVKLSRREVRSVVVATRFLSGSNLWLARERAVAERLSRA